MNPKPINLGVIGCGQRGQGHLKCLGVVPQIRVVALADVHEPSLAAALQMVPAATTFRDYGDLLEMDEVEAVLIAAPNFLHAEIAVAALAAGKDVFCEKPLATTVTECNRLVTAVEQSDRIFYLGFDLRCSPVLQKTRAVIAAGEFGDVRMVSCRELRLPFLKKVEDWIVQEQYSGGALTDKNCHHFDVFNWLIDSEPVSVFASGGTDSVYRDGGKDMSMWEHLRDPATHIDVVDNAIAIVDYANGARAGLTVCFFAPDHPLEIEVLCDHGRLSSDEDNYRLTTFHHVRDERQCHTFEPDVDRDTFDSFEKVYTVLEHREFVQCVQERRQPKADVHVGWWATMMCLAAERSIKEKRPICIRDMKRED